MSDSIAEARSRLPPVEAKESNHCRYVPQVRPSAVCLPTAVSRDRNSHLRRHLPLLHAEAPASGTEGCAKCPLRHLDPLVPAKWRSNRQERQMTKRHRRSARAAISTTRAASASARPRRSPAISARFPGPCWIGSICRSRCRRSRPRRSRPSRQGRARR